MMRRRRCGTRKIDTKSITIRARHFELLIYLEGDYSFTIVNQESSMKLTGDCLKSLLEAAMEYLETYVGIKWEPKLLVDFECDEDWNKQGRRISFTWKPILIRDRYNERGVKQTGKVYRDNDANHDRYSHKLELCTSTKKIVAIISDTPELRAALEQFSKAIEGAGERIVSFLRPETLEASITAGFQKLIGGK